MAEDEITTATTKDDNTMVTPPLPEGWTRCRVYNPQKRRYCRQELLPGLPYCGNHQGRLPQANPPNTCLPVTINSSTAAQSLRVGRVPCPLDPSHTIAANRVTQHVRKCPAATRQHQVEQATYYVRNINKGGCGNLEQTQEAQKASTDCTELQWAQRVALAVLQVHYEIFLRSKQSSSHDQRDVKTLTLEEIHEALPLEDLSAYEIQSGLESAIERYRIKSGGPKHVRQQASLLGHLRRWGALPSPNLSPQSTDQPAKKPRIIDSAAIGDVGRDSSGGTSNVIFEMGAGRGMLGLVAAGVSANTHPTRLVLVERSGSRGKADTVLRNYRQHDTSSSEMADCAPYLNLENLQWTRIRCDLAHVHMETVLQEQDLHQSSVQSRIHVIAKHLCGAGTDLALKSLESVKDKIATCLFATCCHGVCTWEDYVGRDFLRQRMTSSTTGGLLSVFGAAEFELIRRWSAGTVIVKNRDGEDADGHPSAKNQDESATGSPSAAIGKVVDSLQLACGAHGLGRCCQRLIDYGRREYLSKVLFGTDSTTVELVHYVPPDVTPQNAVLLAQRQTIKISGIE